MFTNLQAQSSSLIYFKNYLDTNNGRGQLELLEDGEHKSYVMARHYLQNNADVGIWTENEITGISQGNAAVIFYDESFNYQSHIALPSSINGMSIGFEPIGLSDSLYYFKGITSSPINLNFTSNPPMQSSELYVYANNLIFSYDLNAHEISPIDHWGNVITTVPPPYWGYGEVINSFQNIDLPFSGALISNQRIVSTIPLFGNHENNWDMNYESLQGHKGYLWSNIDLATGTNEVIPVISSFGNVETRAMHYSPEQDKMYRIGMVRGHNTSISPEGSAWLTSPADSAYYTFLASESTEGNEQWSIPIYGFSNTNPDTLNPDGPDYFSFRSGTQSFAELNNNLYFSHSIQMSFSEGDTIFFKDVFGNTQEYNSMLTGYTCAFSSRSIYKITATGEPASKLSFDLELNSNHPNNFSGNNNAFKERIFRIGNKLAWVNVHQNTDGSPAVFKREMSNGDISLSDQIIPPGRSISISWLNEDLEFLEFWTIPFESSSAAPKIEFMGQYNGDTLLIQGNTHGLTSCNYDPSGLAPAIETPMNSTFIAFYSGLNSLGSMDFEHTSYKLKVYPNPSTGLVNVLAPFPLNRIVVSNLLGQVVMGQGAMQQLATTVNLEDLPAGMYLLSAEGTDQRITQRVMVQH